jgi:aminoglycoside phosphotransferase (APT) family kinase protein
VPVEQEIALGGGVANAGAVTRVGDVVLRPQNPHTRAIGALLAHLHDVGFDAVPEPLGTAPDGREQFAFIPGDVPCPPFPAWSLTDDVLASTAALLRAFHDAQVGFVVPLDASWSDEMADPRGGPVICHNDVCPENVVFLDGVAVALLDFDFAAPGRPLHDLAQLAKMWVPLDTDEDAARYGRGGLDPFLRLRVVADGYGLPPGRSEFLDVLGQSIAVARTGGFVRRQIERGHQAFTDMANTMGGLERYERRYRWFEQHRGRFADALG